jgi:tRNA A-37 threonylcarbamoyl transferase component Bud32/predicted hydrocarbon binding protein
VHGLFFFFIQKFADTSAANVPPQAAADLRSRIEQTSAYLPDGSCPENVAAELLDAVSLAYGEPVEQTHARFGGWVASHLIRVAGGLVDPSWRTLEVLEHADDLIHSLARDEQVSEAAPVHEAVRVSPTELHLVYYSQRKLCGVAKGIMHGVAVHFGETIDIKESACMHQGAPFCSFAIRQSANGGESHIVPTRTTTVTRRPTSDRHLESAPTDRPCDDDSIPTQIGPYPVLCALAHGAMGRVLLARDDQLGRPVAIKIMQPSRARDPEAKQRFLREGRTAAAISHPHVLTVYGVGDHDGKPYIVMQHLEGRPLSTCARPMRLPEALRIGREIASGLAAAHAKGLIHRDIKPHNIILEEPHQRVRIIDFGLALEPFGQSPSLTTDGMIVGTPAYLAPERIGNDPVDARTDLFGLGVLLYELISGRLPYEGDSTLTMLASIARGDPIPLARAAPAVPRDVGDFVMRLLAHRPEDRPRDAESVETALAALEHQYAVAAPT